MQETKWYNLGVEESLHRADSSPLGLSPREAERRLARYGPNELQKTGGISPLRIFLAQFRSPLIIVLIAAAIVAGAIGELLDSTVILAIVILSAIFGFVQEYRAERAIEALQELAAPAATVVREGERSSIPATNLVPGDVVLLEVGGKVPADLRLLEATNLATNEASLTGESVPVTKETDALDGDVYVGDRSNMGFMGTTVERGRGMGLVAATGMQTELGRIAGLVQAEPAEETPLQRRLGRLAAQIGLGVLAVAAIVFLVGLSRSVEIVLMFLTAVSLAVAAIPEGLPAVVTITLALGLQRMARRNALIKRLPAAETLGSATVICSDKTGTLTRGEMNVRRIVTLTSDYTVVGPGFVPKGRFLRDGQEVDPLEDPRLALLLRAGMLNNDAALAQEDGAWSILGDTTEGTLIVAGARAGLRKEVLDEEEPRVGEIGFDSDRKRMTTVHRGDRLIAYVKGAPEVLLDRSVRAFAEEEVELDDALRERIREVNREMAEQALRVLALAYRVLPSDMETFEEDVVERDLVFLGLVGMMDAPRPDAIDAVLQAKRSGIRSVMITGDHRLTAQAVAREMGILEEGDETLTGAELERLTDDGLYGVADEVQVYARVSPHHKVRIVDALKRGKHVAAMTGDGVNDAPALKRADIGVAMGITGTDVAREASDMVLTDDNFASIVNAVKEGRGIFDNIRKFVGYLLSANAGEVMVVFLGVLLFVQPELVPFMLPIQILWINLVTDGLPALALGVDPIAEDIMDRPPKPANESPLNREVAVAIVGVGLLAGVLGIFGVQLVIAGQPSPLAHDVVARARTVVFTFIVVFELLFVFSIRALRHPLPLSRPLANRWLILAVGASFLLQLLVIYLPPLQGPFGTIGLGVSEWLLILGLAALVIVLFEAGKLIHIALLRRTPDAPMPKA
ncbi:MAG: cation-translocating P-type ATPase [Thermoplasmata archaeon]